MLAHGSRDIQKDKWELQKKFKIRNQKSRGERERERETTSSSSYVLVNKTVMFQFEIYFSNLT